MLNPALKKRIEELLARHARQDTAHASSFLSPEECADAAGFLQEEPSACFLGGYPGAERRILLLLPSWQEEAEAEADALAAIRIHASGPLGHRDYLGAILALGIDRGCVGDILVSDTGAELIALAHMAPYLADTLVSVGRYAVRAEPIPLSEIAAPERRSERIRRTVPQLRLDCVLAAAFSLSRGRAAALIEQGAVQLRHTLCMKREKPVQEGDAISIRGMGKAIVAAVGGRTGKDRIWVEIERLL